jgi:hypothetical protein
VNLALTFDNRLSPFCLFLIVFKDLVILFLLFHHLSIQDPKQRSQTSQSINEASCRGTSLIHSLYGKIQRGSGGRDRMVAGFTTTCAISAYHH